jgi:endonuclease YncB( thermonuclease family)
MLPDGRSLNQELVTAGMAWWYRQYAKDDASLATLEAEAKAAKRGLWSDPHA